MCRQTTAGKCWLSFSALRLSELPPDVVDHAKACLRDALGCGVFGSGQVWSRILADEMLADGSAGHSTVIGRQQSLAAPAAALCNGTAIHGFELDDLIAESITHPAACVIPAAIAAAEAADASGEKLLEAIVAGYEADASRWLGTRRRAGEEGLSYDKPGRPYCLCGCRGQGHGPVGRSVDLGGRLGFFGCVRGSRALPPAMAAVW